MSWLGAAISVVTGDNVVRLVGTASIAFSLGAVSAWQVQQWRWRENTAAETVQRAEAAVEEARLRDRIVQAAIANTTNAEEIYEAKFKKAQLEATRNASELADLKRVLDAAQCSANESVRDGKPTSSYDAADARWQLERGRVKSN